MANKLPLLLAGPILRRAELDGVWIWVATTKEVTRLAPLIVPYDREGRQGQSLTLAYDEKDRRSIRLGEQLWVTLFRLRPDQGSFVADQIYGYDFALHFADGDIQELKDLVDDLKSLVYAPFALPTFFFPSGRATFAVGSCRRAGAKGTDSYHALGSEMSNVAKQVASRPAALLLCGDQIYADDVPPSLFRAVRDLSVDAMGFDEHLPYAQLTKDRVDSDVPAGKIGYGKDVGSRRANVRNFKLTTDDGEGHLLTFGEFAAMYLLVWNPQLCDAYGLEANLASSGQDVWLKGFTAATREARRAMANLPTYMMFDDHEVTDDWNADAQWVKDVDNKFGRRLIANALAAFWAFQGWGNQAVLRGRHARLGAVIGDHLDKLRTAGGTSYDGHADAYERPLLDHRAWSFITPTEPPVVGVDLRTARDFTSKAPSLIDAGGRDRLKSLLYQHPAGAPIVMILPTPILPWEPLMEARRKKAWLQDLVGQSRAQRLAIEAGDMWSDYHEGRAEFLAWVRDNFGDSPLVALSGDVHCGYAASGTAFVAGKRTLPIVQITSSALKNETALNDVYDTGIDKTKVANYFEELLSTGGMAAAELPNGSTVVLMHKAETLRGPLGYETVIPENNVSLVSFEEVHKFGWRGRYVRARFLGFHGANLVEAEAQVQLGELTKSGAAAGKANANGDSAEAFDVQRALQMASHATQTALPGVLQGAATGAALGPAGAVLGGLAGGAAALTPPRTAPPQVPPPQPALPAGDPYAAAVQLLTLLQDPRLAQVLAAIAATQPAAKPAVPTRPPVRAAPARSSSPAEWLIEAGLAEWTEP